jgi:hypothetical protein
LASNDQPTISELQKCRAKLVCLIEGAQELDAGKSSELCTAEGAFKAIDERIQELRTRNAKKGSWHYPMKRA